MNETKLRRLTFFAYGIVAVVGLAGKVLHKIILDKAMITGDFNSIVIFGRTFFLLELITCIGLLVVLILNGIILRSFPERIKDRYLIFFAIFSDCLVLAYLLIFEFVLHILMYKIFRDEGREMYHKIMDFLGDGFPLFLWITGLISFVLAGSFPARKKTIT